MSSFETRKLRIFVKRKRSSDVWNGVRVDHVPSRASGLRQEAERPSAGRRKLADTAGRACSCRRRCALLSSGFTQGTKRAFTWKDLHTCGQEDRSAVLASLKVDNMGGSALGHEIGRWAREEKAMTRTSVPTIRSTRLTFSLSVMPESFPSLQGSRDQVPRTKGRARAARSSQDRERLRHGEV